MFISKLKEKWQLSWKQASHCSSSQICQHFQLCQSNPFTSLKQEWQRVGYLSISTHLKSNPITYITTQIKHSFKACSCVPILQWWWWLGMNTFQFSVAVCVWENSVLRILEIWHVHFWWNDQKKNLQYVTLATLTFLILDSIL